MNYPNKPTAFGTAIIDWPWPGFGVEHIYSTMTESAILTMARDISYLFDDNAVVWQWVANKNIIFGHEVLTALGFRYVSMLTWVKPRMGRGRPLRNMTEHVLVGIKGRPEIRFRGQGTWLFAPVQDPSHKPEELHAIAERISDGPYLELFARRPRPGWTTWGDELPSSDLVIPGYPITRSHQSEEAA